LKKTVVLFIFFACSAIRVG